jgi:hypothetical protein
MSYQKPEKVGKDLGETAAKMIKGFEYWRPNKDFRFVQVRELPKLERKTDDAVKWFAAARKKYDAEQFLIKNTFAPFIAMITAPTADDEEQVMEYIYKLHMEDMNKFMEIDRMIRGEATGLRGNGWGMTAKYNMHDVIKNFDDFRKQMFIVKDHIEKVCKSIMVRGAY